MYEEECCILTVQVQILPGKFSPMLKTYPSAQSQKYKLKQCGRIEYRQNAGSSGNKNA